MLLLLKLIKHQHSHKQEDRLIQPALCPGESIGFNPGDESPLVFEWGGGATSVRVESLNPSYTISTGPGGTLTDLGGGFWRVEGVNSLL